MQNFEACCKETCVPILFQGLNAKASDFIQTGSVFYVIFYNLYITPHIIRMIKSTTVDLKEHREKENCNQFYTTWYIHVPVEGYDIKSDLIEMGCDYVDSIYVADNVQRLIFE